MVESIKNDPGNRVEEEIKERVLFQRDVSMTSRSKRVKEVAELLDHKDKCV